MKVKEIHVRILKVYSFLYKAREEFQANCVLKRDDQARGKVYFKKINKFCLYLCEK